MLVETHAIATTIRQLLITEIEQALPLMKEFVIATKMPIMFNPDKALRSWTKLYELNRGMLWGAWQENALIGIIGMQVFEFFYADGVGINEIVWWVHPEHRSGSAGLRLLKEAEAWAKLRGIPNVMLGCFAHLDGDRLAKLYARMGYVCWGATFLKELH